MNCRTLRWSLILALLHSSSVVCSPGRRRRGGSEGRASRSALRCEYLHQPAGYRRPEAAPGLDAERGSWHPESAGVPRSRGQQPRGAAKGPGRPVDSGRVASSQNTWVEYGGKPLVSGQRAIGRSESGCEGRHRPSVERAGLLSMGLLQASDWHSRFIGQRAPAGATEGLPCRSHSSERRSELKQKPARAVAYLNALGYYELYINGRRWTTTC